MGDVVSIGTGKVVQSDDPTPGSVQRSVTEPEASDQDLMLDDEQVLDFITVVGGLDYCETRESQREVMNQIRAAVKAWPDG